MVDAITQEGEEEGGERGREGEEVGKGRDRERRR